MQTTEKLGERIRRMLREKDMTQAELARLAGIKQQTISYIVGGESAGQSSRYTTKIAEALGVNPVWLATGSGNPHDPTVPIRVDGVTVESIMVPILRPSEVAAFLGGQPPPTNRVLMSDTATAGASFALEIAGESMAPTFREGDRVVVDTSLKPEPGDYVAAIAGEVVLFRRFRQRHPGFELVPENPDWETLASDESVRVIGVMTEHRTYRKVRR